MRAIMNTSVDMEDFDGAVELFFCALEMAIYKAATSRDCLLSVYTRLYYITTWISTSA